MHYKNLCKKTSFQATDATTQSSNQEENEFFLFLFYFFILLQNHTTRKNDDNIKTKRNKRKLWLKRRSQPESEHKMRKKQSRYHRF
jgi:hypothetical protein